MEFVPGAHTLPCLQNSSLLTTLSLCMLLMLLQFNFSLFPLYRTQIADLGTPFYCQLGASAMGSCSTTFKWVPGECRTQGAGMHPLLPWQLLLAWESPAPSLLKSREGPATPHLKLRASGQTPSPVQLQGKAHPSPRFLLPPISLCFCPDSAPRVLRSRGPGGGPRTGLLLFEDPEFCLLPTPLQVFQPKLTWTSWV